MDAHLQLAVMEKVRRTFQSTSTFVTFPIVPTSFRAEQLRAINNGATSAPDLNAAATWSRLVNLVPDGGVLMTPDRPLLWNCVDRIAKSAVVLAKSKITAADKKSVKDAEAVLYAKDGAPSKKLTSYNQYRDLWFGAKAARRKREAEVALSADPAEKEFWNETERRLHDDKVAQALEAWRTAGFSDEVDLARRTIQTIRGKAPDLAWSDWLRRFDLEIDGISDLNSALFIPTGFGPSDFMSSNSWISFSLDRDEISSLVANAAPSLKDKFGGAALKGNVQTISFDCTSVSVLRGWFWPDTLTARFWQFSDVSRVISDGGQPPSGECAAYVVAAIFVRDIAVTYRADDVDKPEVDLPPAFTIGALKGFSKFEAPILVMPSEATFDEQMTVTEVDTKWADALKIGSGSMDPLEPPKISPILPKQLKHKSWTYPLDDLKLPLPPSKKPKPPVTDDVVVARTYTGGEMGVLAFVCVGLPKVPNPDPSLEWPESGV